MIIFFGDHLPNLGQVFDDYGFYANAEEKAQKNDEKFFSTPLAVWSNFDLDKSIFSEKLIPAHFLAQKVLHAANLPTSGYYDFMKSVNDCYSQIHQTGTKPSEHCQSKNTDVLQQYKDLNMDVLNGKNYSYDFLNPKSTS